MKTANTIRFTALATCLAALSGCISIPSAYRGDFVDRVTGTKLQISSSAMAWGAIKSKIMAMKFADLAKGKPGIYVASDGKHDKVAQIYWVRPDLSTRQEGAGFVWFTAAVVLAEVDMTTPSKPKINTFDATQCNDGTVLLDMTQNQWQVGCPESARKVRFDRVAAKR